MKPLTPNQGATDERTAWMAKLRRVQKSVSALSGAGAIIANLIAWGKSRAKRCNAKLGGIGK